VLGPVGGLHQDDDLAGVLEGLADAHSSTSIA
jgi:hypothetical protein